jgi:gluconate 2-dehydrogenase gamma chain
LLPRRALAEALAQATGPFRFFTAHQADVVREATARLIPGPTDDPAEAGHPGAREANVVRYIDTLLAAFTFGPPKIYAGGPFSVRAGGRRNDMARFVAPRGIRARAWRKRVAGLRRAYRSGVSMLDSQAGGDFAGLPGEAQDLILASSDAAAFRDILFTHAIEGMYAVPEYGGNAGLVGWRDISFPGDTQPRGFTPAQVAESDGPDPVVPDALVEAVRAHFQETVWIMRGIRGRHGR